MKITLYVKCAKCQRPLDEPDVEILYGTLKGDGHLGYATASIVPCVNCVHALAKQYLDELARTGKR